MPSGDVAFSPVKMPQETSNAARSTTRSAADPLHPVWRLVPAIIGRTQRADRRGRFAIKRSNRAAASNFELPHVGLQLGRQRLRTVATINIVTPIVLLGKANVED